MQAVIEIRELKDCRVFRGWYAWRVDSEVGILQHKWISKDGVVRVGALDGASNQHKRVRLWGNCEWLIREYEY